MVAFVNRFEMTAGWRRPLLLTVCDFPKGKRFRGSHGQFAFELTVGWSFYI
jgi:hypothetical protein